ncbi:MAG: hypothetical protein GX076_03715 [Clostridiales bacterium]|nr:hypothetical protein [Clostridiales bacterium]
MRYTTLKLGEMLVRSGVISQEAMSQALKEQKGSGKRIGEILIEGGYITERQLIDSLSSQLDIEYVDLDIIKGDIYLSEYVPESIARSKYVAPIGKKGNTLKLAVTDPLDYNTLNDINTYSKMNVDVVLAERDKIQKRIHELYVSKQAKEAAYELAKAAEMIPKQSVDFHSSDQPIVRLVNMMIDQAVNLKASDIHIEPGEEHMRVRFRIDGYLV